LLWKSTTTLVGAVYFFGVFIVTTAAIAMVVNRMSRMIHRRALQTCRMSFRFTRLAPVGKPALSEDAFFHVKDVVRLQHLGELHATGLDLVSVASLEREVFLACPGVSPPLTAIACITVISRSSRNRPGL
jgi:hypothetical protein